MPNRKLKPSRLSRDRSRELRNNMSKPEVILWLRLRRKQTGFFFLRQRPLGPYIADFYCHEARLVVEVDGYQHASNITDDLTRDAFLRAQHIETVRFPAADVLKDAASIAHAIKHICERRVATLDPPNQARSPAHPPRQA